METRMNTLKDTPGYADMMILAGKHEGLREKCQEHWDLAFDGEVGAFDTIEAHAQFCACKGQMWTLSEPKTWMRQLVRIIISKEWDVHIASHIIVISDGLGNMKASVLAVKHFQDGDELAALATALVAAEAEEKRRDDLH